MTGYAYSLTMDVRDYECDIQGIVNNGVYQNYLEHARHEYLKEIGLDFADLASRGINLVVIRAELDYKLPLTSGDRFEIGVNMVRESKARFAFYQDIVRSSDGKLVLKAKIMGTALNERGRPSIPQELEPLLNQ
ncbi:thioesterase family protein [Motiliproteus sp. MSK22-1]|uniref:acyl-CoA thioesterase n=1 Tax=Motiliproteus sp. MSK22-1 TaxID=1897630 RepID=UPI00097841EC|nr:acyl-CoA thioesterase [Motiliproteus sp. MSK22-1]OMH38269.1 thioesterase [Motiliproteus sp. MSK22-1]